MNATAHPKLAMRPFLPAETPLVAEIFRASIEELAADDYSDTQRQAWAAVADDEAAFGARLAGQLTLLGTMGGSPVGFASLKAPDHFQRKARCLGELCLGQPARSTAPAKAGPE